MKLKLLDCTSDKEIGNFFHVNSTKIDLGSGISLPCLLFMECLCGIEAKIVKAQHSFLLALLTPLQKEKKSSLSE